MNLPKRSRRQIIITLTIAIASFAGSLAPALQTAPRPAARVRRHDVHILTASASGHEGHDEWYIDEDNNDSTGDASLAFENPSQLDDGTKENDIRFYFATCIPGLQNTLASELTALGAKHVETQGRSGVRFEGSPEVGLKSILWSRTAHRIMELIASSSEPPPAPDDLDFDYGDASDFSHGIRNREDLYQFARSAVHVPSLLGDGRGGLLTLSCTTIYASKAPNKDLCHGHFTALTVKNALVDAVRDMREGGDRPNVDVEDPDVPLVVVIQGRRANDYGRRGRRDGRGRQGNDWSYEDEEDEYVADVDLYRCLHSGGSLHRRGYRQSEILDAEVYEAGYEGEDNWKANGRPQNAIGKAPIHRAAMKESLAAGLLLEAGWDKLVNAARGDGEGAVLVDPMTGSGTLPTEAALIACDMAPGLLRIASWRGDGGGGDNPHRRPPCTRWKDFSDIETWDSLVAKAAKRAKTGMKWARSRSELTQRKNVNIFCNEMNPRAVRLAQTSIRNAGLSSLVLLNEGDCIDWYLSEPGGGGDGVVAGRTIFVANPPWGLRLTQDIDSSWVSLREFLRREAGGCESWVLSGNKGLTKILRMKTSRKVVVKTADEDLRWLQYYIFQKSRAESVES